MCPAFCRVCPNDEVARFLGQRFAQATLGQNSGLTFLSSPERKRSSKTKARTAEFDRGRWIVERQRRGFESFTELEITACKLLQNSEKIYRFFRVDNAIGKYSVDAVQKQFDHRIARCWQIRGPSRESPFPTQRGIADRARVWSLERPTRITNA